MVNVRSYAEVHGVYFEFIIVIFNFCRLPTHAYNQPCMVYGLE